MSNWLDVSYANRYTQMYIKGFLDISGGNLIVRNNHFYLQKGDASLNGNLFVATDTSLNGRLSVGNDVTFNQKLIVNGDVSLNGNTYINYASNSIPPSAIQGGIPLSTGVFTSDISVNSRLFVNQDVSFNSHLYVANTIYENGSSLSSKYATIASPTFTGTVSGITQSMVGLSNVNNTADLDKPISTATQNALNVKANIASPAFTGIPTVPTASYGTSTTQIASTAFVLSQLTGYAQTTSPSFFTQITTPKLFATSDVSFTGTKFFVTGDSSMNGNVKVGKSIYEGGVALVSKYATLASPTFTGNVTIPTANILNDSSLNGNVYIGKDLTVNGNLTVNTYTSKQTVTSVSYEFIVAEDMSLNGRLFTTGDVSLNSRLFLGSDASFAGKLFVNGDVSLNGNVTVVTPSFTDNSNKVATTSFVYSKLSSLTNGANFTGDVSFNQSLYLSGNALMNSSLFVNGDLSLNGNANINGNLTAITPSLTDNSNKVATTSFIKSLEYAALSGANFTGDVSFNERLFVTNDTSLNGNLFVSSKTILENDVSMNQNLDLSGSMIAHNNLNVYGIINQYTTTLDQGYIVNYATSGVASNGDLSANGIVVGNSTTNTFIGIHSGNSITSGTNNTCFGYQSGNTLTTGSNNIVIGNGANASSATVSNEITLGNSSMTTLRCQVPTITSLSDLRDKTNILDIPAGLNFMKYLHPVKFTWNMRDGSKINIDEFGFIAQELKQAQIDSGITIPNLVNETNPEKLEASYGVLIPILVKSIQELKDLTAKQQSEIELLKMKINA